MLLFCFLFVFHVKLAFSGCPKCISWIVSSFVTISKNNLKKEHMDMSVDYGLPPLINDKQNVPILDAVNDSHHFYTHSAAWTHALPFS